MSDDQVRSQQPLPPPSRVHCVLLTGTWCTHRQKMSYGAVFLDQVKDKKGIYTAIVGGLIVVAFVAPMVQFWFYTGGD